jgi:ribosomal-protein-alanine N-acetyltransferase
MGRLALRPMRVADLEAVTRIEDKNYPYPWTPGNFSDALDSGYICLIAEVGAEMVGYAVLMPGVDDAELLNISIAPERKREGLGMELLEEVLDIARGLGLQRVLLEVRPSNGPALALYRKGGFREMGRRRGYYPADSGREDAIVMEYPL